MGSAKMPAAHDPALPFHVSPALSPAAETDSERAHAMAQAVMEYDPATDADALKLLRALYPKVPLALRAIALKLIARRHSGRAFYIPR